MAVAELPRRRFSSDEYERIVETGILGPEDRVDLIAGEVVEKARSGSRHAACVTKLQIRLSGCGALLRTQQPIRPDDRSEPEPDLALVRRRDDYYAAAHPGPRDVLPRLKVPATFPNELQRLDTSGGCRLVARRPASTRPSAALRAEGVNGGLPRTVRRRHHPRCTARRGWLPLKPFADGQSDSPGHGRPHRQRPATPRLVELLKSVPVRSLGDTINSMKTEDLTRFANRPWQVIGEADAAHWLARKRRLGPAEGIRMAAELRALVSAQRPDWPTPAEREADLEMHARVSEALRSVTDPRTA